MKYQKSFTISRDDAYLLLDRHMQEVKKDIKYAIQMKNSNQALSSKWIAWAKEDAAKALKWAQKLGVKLSLQKDRAFDLNPA